MREDAITRLNRAFAVNKIAELEGLKVSDEEVLARIEEMFKDHDEEEPGHDHTVTDELKESVRRMILSEKTLERLDAIAKGEAPALAPQPVGADQPKAEPKADEPKQETNPTSPVEGDVI
jgi:trigger factor